MLLRDRTLKQDFVQNFSFEKLGSILSGSEFGSENFTRPDPDSDQSLGSTILNSNVKYIYDLNRLLLI